MDEVNLGFVTRTLSLDMNSLFVINLYIDKSLGSNLYVIHKQRMTTVQDFGVRRST